MVRNYAGIGAPGTWSLTDFVFLCRKSQEGEVGGAVEVQECYQTFNFECVEALAHVKVWCIREA